MNEQSCSHIERIQTFHETLWLKQSRRPRLDSEFVDLDFDWSPLSGAFGQLLLKIKMCCKLEFFPNDFWKEFLKRSPSQSLKLLVESLWYRVGSANCTQRTGTSKWKCGQWTNLKSRRVTTTYHHHHACTSTSWIYPSCKCNFQLLLNAKKMFICVHISRAFVALVSIQVQTI